MNTTKDVVTPTARARTVKPRGMKASTAQRAAWWLSAGVLAIGSIAILLPFIFMISTSFNGQARLSVPFPPQIIPEEFSTEAYSIATTGIDIWRLYGNTFLVATVEIILSLGSALLAGYSLSKIRPRGSNIILMVALATMMIPVEATIIPNFLTFKWLGMLDTYWALWLPAIAFPFGTFLVKQYLDSVPDELREAARIDGASELRTLVLVYAPLAKGIIATLVILSFLGSWNSYLWPLIVINNPKLYTIQLGLAAFSQTVGEDTYALPDVNLAATVLSLLPVLAIYLFFQRYIIASVASTAVKG
ncbi:sugar ABC transporter permease [Corynebacterium xerosis]|nr:sugar ABC transporter permease [Corynebacterium xerosis]